MGALFNAMGASFNPSTSYQGAHHVLFVFLLHHDVAAGLGVGSGVSMGPLSADTQPPPSSADSAWFLTQNLGFGLHDDDDETGLPPLNPPGSSNRKPQRNSDLDFRLFAVSNTKPHEKH